MNLYVLIVSLFLSGQVLYAYGQARTTAKASPIKQTANSSAKVLTNKSLITLYDAGVQVDVILAKINASRCKLDLSTSP